MTIMLEIEELRLRMLKMSPKSLFLGLFPILKWSRTYNSKAAVGDLIAGITIALTLIPQSIAYASLAGFNPQYGLYASFMGPFVYAIMGTCPQINLGPSALLSLLTHAYTSGTNEHFGILLCFFSGIVQLILGISQLGFLVEFISLPVVSGFTSAAAMTVASSQVKGLLGLKYHADDFISTWKNIFLNVKKTRLNDAMLSLVCCFLLQGMQALKEIKIKTKTQDEKGRRRAKILKRFLWTIGVARNATVVVLASVIAFFVHIDANNPFYITGDVDPGLPDVKPPPFQTTVGNTTYNTLEMVQHLGSGLIVVPVVAILGNVAIARAFAQGKKVNATQEIIALGMCNLVSSFFQSMVVNGSFSRSAVSNASGVKTPGSGVYTGIIVILCLVLLTPFFYFIPRAALASVIVCAVLQMVDIGIIKTLWKLNRLDIIPLVGTFICCLLVGIQIGLLCGVAIDGMLLLYYHSRPPLDVQFIEDGRLPPHHAIRPVGGLIFASAERVRTKLFSLRHPKATHGPEAGVALEEPDAPDPSTPRILVVYCDALYRFDYTFLESLRMLIMDWAATGFVVWCDARPIIKEQLRGMIPTDLIFCEKSELLSYMSPSVEPETSAGANV